jgi:tRNA(Ile)-lysidine synthase
VSRDSQSLIMDVEADAAFDCLVRFDHVILAVSGGPDSMALMVLAAEWRTRMKSEAPTLSVATVDHGLRPESRAEAEFVRDEAARLRLPHAILTWEGAKPRTGIPTAAREARYRLLDEHARSFGADRIAVVTAHHLDDQAETFAMRLARGAGINGLSGMRVERPLRDGSPIALLRPLLALPKARLVATIAARGVGYADDPTNTDHRYERPRLRSALPDLDTAGLSPQALATSARRLGDAREALVYAEERFVGTLNLSFGNEVFASLDRHAFDHGPAYLRQKVMARLIGRYGGASPEPQLSEIEALATRLQSDRRCTATLGGAMISCGPRFIRVWREVGRLDQGEIELEHGDIRVWDHRFVLRWSSENAGLSRSVMASGITVKPLGAKAYAAIMPRLVPGRRPPTRAASALPSFWAGTQFLAAPSLAPFALSNSQPLNPAGFELNPLATSVTF